MSIAYKNFWSLNTDEAVVAGMLRNAMGKNQEVLMPMNAQMKGIDLVLMNMDNKKSITIQVKGSRAFEPKQKELKKYGHGNVGWFYLEAKTIFEATAEYFIFLVYVLEENTRIGRRTLNPHSIIIPTVELQCLTKKYKKIHGKRYSYYFWINPKTKEALDIRDLSFYVSDYLDVAGYKKLSKLLDGQK